MTPREIETAPDTPSVAPLLDVSGITRRFGAVVACDQVSLSVGAGQILGLLGENGAGKSTLMNIISGVVTPEAGQVTVDGQDLFFGDPKATAAAGIAIVHQQFSLVRSMTVWENLALGDSGRVDARQVCEQITEIGSRYGMAVDPHAVISSLSPGERQRVEIVKCLRRQPRVIMLDEPTSVLSQPESRQLFVMLRRLVEEEHRAAILVSHRLEEILRATDEVAIMRAGRVVSTIETHRTSAKDLARRMLGRDVSLERDGAIVGIEPAEVAEVDSPSPARRSQLGGRATPELEIRDAVVLGTDGRHLLDGLSLSLWPGEILGIAGVEGNGQSAVLDLLSGLARLASGEISLRGTPLNPTQRGELPDVGVIPNDRLETACIIGMSVAENLAVGDLTSMSRHGVMNQKLMRSRARDLVTQYGIVTPSVDAPMRALSGGNQQRVVLARELSRSSKVLVAGQPTQGLDVGATAETWSRLRAAAARGVAVLLISTDLDELLALAHRIVVIQKGSIAGEMARDQVDSDRLALLMGGLVA